MIIMHSGMWNEKFPYCHNIRHCERNWKWFTLHHWSEFIISPIITHLMRKFLKPCWLSWMCEAFYWNNCLSSNSTLSQNKKATQKKQTNKAKAKATACIAVESLISFKRKFIVLINGMWNRRNLVQRKKIMRKRKECKKKKKKIHL